MLHHGLPLLSNPLLAVEDVMLLSDEEPTECSLLQCTFPNDVPSRRANHMDAVCSVIHRELVRKMERYNVG